MRRDAESPLVAVAARLVLPLTIGAALLGCGRSHQPIPSPDGTLSLQTRIEEGDVDPGARGCVVFEVRDAAGRVLHSENTRASEVMRWNLAWESNDAVKLESSDIGSWTWRRRPDGTWKKDVPPGYFEAD